MVNVAITHYTLDTRYHEPTIWLHRADGGMPMAFNELALRTRLFNLILYNDPHEIETEALKALMEKINGD